VLLSKIFGKKSIVVVGGYDVACIPEIGYGRFASGRYNSILTKFALKYCDAIVIVDAFLKNNIENNAKVYRKDIRCIPTGYDYKFWQALGEKKNIVLTVALAYRRTDLLIKGLEVFVNCAKLLPEVKFVVVGAEAEAAAVLKAMDVKNCEIIGFQEQKSLISYYRAAKVYCQLSMCEGLPNSLCEAMLCECVPVGSDIPGIRSAIGDTGFYVPYADMHATVQAIKNALNATLDIGGKARDRITSLFPLEKREKALSALVDELSRLNH
jgi:glycosyltransferase involved in cell wall biosynthesis